MDGKVWTNESNGMREVETLLFGRGLETATAVTDGQTVKCYTSDDCRAFRSLGAAIGHLEALGYSIIIV